MRLPSLLSLWESLDSWGLESAVFCSSGARNALFSPLGNESLIDEQDIFIWAFIFFRKIL